LYPFELVGTFVGAFVGELQSVGFVVGTCVGAGAYPLLGVVGILVGLSYVETVGSVVGAFEGELVGESVSIFHERSTAFDDSPVTLTFQSSGFHSFPLGVVTVTSRVIIVFSKSWSVPLPFSPTTPYISKISKGPVTGPLMIAI
jgi:hypothetical protein